MKKTAFFLMSVVTLFSLQCKKDSTVAPDHGDHTVPSIGMYRILPHGVEAIPPQEVNLLCNVIDTSNNPVDFLTASKFAIKENDVSINAGKAGLYIRKRNTLDYNFDTILMLDVSSAVNLETLKKAARSFVASMDADQSVAIYAFSNTVNLLQSLTRDAAQLTQAIDNMTTKTADRNLLSAIKQGMMQVNESYSPTIVHQGQLIVFAAGPDTKSEANRDEIIYTSQFSNIYTIGLGNEIDRDLMDQVGNRGFYAVVDENKVEDSFVKVQASIAKFADSFYRIVYKSSLRGAASQSVQLSIVANTYDGAGSTMTGVFKTDQFEDVPNGLTVDWMPAIPDGIDSLIIGINLPRHVKAFSQGGDAVPVYEWSCSNSEIITVEPVVAGLSEAVLLAAQEGTTMLIVKDKSNGFADTVMVKSVRYHNRVIVREWWNDLSGSAMTSLTFSPQFPDFPTGREYLVKTETAQNWGDNFGARLRGFVHPTVGGTYSFWIASDDASQLFFSVNEDPGQKTLIAKVDTYTGYQAFEAFASQHSADFTLEAGKYYYIEVLHKEGGGGDNLSVAWQGPDIKRSVISADNISAWLGD